MSWEELRFKEEAKHGVKGRFCGETEGMLVYLGCASEGVGKVLESQVGKCQAEMETWSSRAACPWHGAVPTGRGGDRTCTQSWPWQ